MNFLSVYSSDFKNYWIGEEYGGRFFLKILPCKYSMMLSLGSEYSLAFEKQFANFTSASVIHYGRSYRNPPHPNVFAQKKIPTRFGYEELEANYISFLKIDCGGGEWRWLEKIPSHAKDNIKQMIIVFNNFNKSTERKTKILNDLTDTHYLVHIQPDNNKGIFSHPSANFPIFQKFRATYIHRSFFPEPPSLNKKSFPWVNDRPINPSRPLPTINYQPYVF